MLFESIIASTDFSVHQSIYSMLLRKVIAALDLRLSSDPLYTDRLQIYLENSSVQAEPSFTVVEIYGVREDEQSTDMVLCTALNFCVGFPSAQAKLPERSALDQKLLGLSDADHLNNPKVGFKNAVGLTITGVEYTIQNKQPHLEIVLANHYYIRYIYVTLSEAAMEEQMFKLSLLYD